MNIKTNLNTFDAHAKFTLKHLENVIDWNQHPHMSSQHIKFMTTSHFNNYLHILIVSKLHWS